MAGMSSQLKSSEQVGYAALGQRFRAYVRDAVICLGVFVLGGITSGIVFENSSGARIAIFLMIGAIILGYEPLMVARYGGTFGHRSANIRVVRVQTGDNLPFWRAAIRTLVKWIFGFLSFGFMFLTNRAQGIHDLIAGSEVRIRDPHIGLETDYFVPRLPSRPLPASRRIIVVVLYSLLVSIMAGVLVALLISPACLDRDVCSSSESQVVSILGFGWLLAFGMLIFFGWTGRLPGCRNSAE